MKRIRALIPFHLAKANRDCVPGDELEASDKLIAELKGFNVNMVEVLGDAEEKPKETRRKAKAQ